MLTEAKNEAAERLRNYARKTWRTDTPKGREHGEEIPQSQFLADLDAALATERRYTTQQIRARIIERREVIRGDVPILLIVEILDEVENPAPHS